MCTDTHSTSLYVKDVSEYIVCDSVYLGPKYIFLTCFDILGRVVVE